MRAAVMLAFAIAGACSLALTPLARAIAIATHFVDNPAARKVHRTATPYLGGIAIILAVLVAVGAVSTAFHPSIGFAATILLAVLMGMLGLVDDSRLLSAATRFCIQLVAAGGAVLLGTHLEVTGVAPVDRMLTIVLIVGVTNSLNLLDNMDGLCGGIAATIGAGVAVVGVLRGQPMMAITGAAVLGATVGYLSYNIRPALLFMGDSGAVFLGFLLSVIVVRSGAPITRADGSPAAIALVVLTLVVPVLDTATVCLARTRRGISVSQGGKDHLSHRLVRCGRTPGAAVGTLVALNLTCILLAVAMVDQRLSLRTTLALAVGAVLVVLVPAWRADVYPPDDPRLVARRLERAGSTGEAVTPDRAT